MRYASRSSPTRPASMCRRALMYADQATSRGRALHPPPQEPAIATLTPDELAKAGGAARPSAARILADLKREGHIRSVRGGLLIARPSELVEPGQRGAA